jgi:hypothetical protein
LGGLSKLKLELRTTSLDRNSQNDMAAVEEKRWSKLLLKQAEDGACASAEGERF